VYIHCRRLDKVSPWFGQNAPNNKILKMDSVSAHTLQAFYSWVYDDVVEIKGVQQALDDDEASSVDDAEATSENEEGAGEDDEDPTLEASEQNTVSPPIKTENTDSNAEGTEPDVATPRAADDESTPWCIKPDFNAASQVYGRLLDVYLFSIKYEIPGLKLAALLAWQNFYWTFKSSCSLR
jgi:hypothetical protein